MVLLKTRKYKSKKRTTIFKVCTICGKRKAIRMFIGKADICRQCATPKERVEEQRALNRICTEGHRKNHPEYYIEHKERDLKAKRDWERKQRLILSDFYINKLIAGQFHIKTSEIPEGLVFFKRAQLQMRRVIKEINSVS